MALVTQQILEQLELPRGQVEEPLAADGAPAHQIHLQVGRLQTKRLRRTAAPQQRPNPRQQFRQRKGLDEIVVRAEIQAEHAIVHPVAGGQDQHRRVDVPLPQRLQDLEAAPSRKHDVEHDQVEGLGIRAKKPVLTR